MRDKTYHKMCKRAERRWKFLPFQERDIRWKLTKRITGWNDMPGRTKSEVAAMLEAWAATHQTDQFAALEAAVLAAEGHEPQRLEATCL
jgi:hypothetical protein